MDATRTDASGVQMSTPACLQPPPPPHLVYSTSKKKTVKMLFFLALHSQENPSDVSNSHRKINILLFSSICLVETLNFFKKK